MRPGVSSDTQTEGFSLAEHAENAEGRVRCLAESADNVNWLVEPVCNLKFVFEERADSQQLA